MKLLHSLIFIFLFGMSLFGQNTNDYYVNGMHLDSIKNKYIEVQICNKPLSRSMWLIVDYGQEQEWISRQNQRLSDASGNFVEFKSNMDALNFIIQKDFELVQSNYTVVNSDTNLICLLRRKS